MNRKLDREYVFTEREVHEALIAALRKKDIPAPQYVDDTPTTTWIWENATISVRWTDVDDIDLQ